MSGKAKIECPFFAFCGYQTAKNSDITRHLKSSSCPNNPAHTYGGHAHWVAIQAYPHLAITNHSAEAQVTPCSDHCLTNSAMMNLTWDLTTCLLLLVPTQAQRKQLAEVTACPG